jgi:hypothetical protein
MLRKTSECKLVNVIAWMILTSLLVNACLIVVSGASKNSFSGLVYAVSGVPVSGALVVASGPSGYGYATTNSLGQFAINEGLEMGTYTVNVIAEGYLYEEKENVAVTVGSETGGVDLYLHLSGGISGKITDIISGVPLQDIIVWAMTSSSGNYGGSGLTDADGNYRITSNLGTGTYNVSVLFPEGHATKQVGGIVVTAGSEVKNVNLALERSGIISGKATATPSGAALQNVTVSAVSSGGDYGYAQTNATGHYKILSGLGTGTYTVFATYQTSFDQIEDVNVVAGEEASDINFELAVSPPPPSGILMGKVVDTNSEPILNAHVTAQGSAGNGDDYTDENGNYVISSGLGTGTYTVSASATGYETQDRIGIHVTVNQITANANLQLARIPPEQSGRITGTIQGDPDPIPEVQYPLAYFLIGTLMTAGLVKLLVTRKRREPQQ